MKKRIQLIAAPTAIQPGDYVGKAYADETEAVTPWVDLQAEKSGSGWNILVIWPCSNPVKKITHDVNLFGDAVAILAPSNDEAIMMTMGSPSSEVNGSLWRADKKVSYGIQASGLGSVVRSELAPEVRVQGTWSEGMWGVRFELQEWAFLENTSKLGIAVWNGQGAQRAGLKSVTGDWVSVE